MPVKKKSAKKKTTPRPVGRPTKYKPEYCQVIIKYFDIEATDSDGNANNPKYLSAFARSIGVNQDTLHEWCAVHPQFSEAFSNAKDIQKEYFITAALQNRYNAGFTWRAMMNMFGWREKTDNIHTGEDGKELFPVLTDKEKTILAGINGK